MFVVNFRRKRYSLLCMLLIPLLSCTVVRHDEKAGDSEDDVTFYFENESFDATSYVKDNWDTRIIPEILKSSHELETVLSGLGENQAEAEKAYGIRKEELSPFSFMVKGQFLVDSLDLESSAGLLYLNINDLTGENRCAVQVGPVIKMSMVRDALEFIKFGDFSNQIEFANISREINFYIRDNVVDRSDDAYTVGMKIELYGVFTLDGTGKVLITPVILLPLGGE